MDELEFNYPPQFATGPNGKPTSVTLDVKTYIRLLVWSNVTDPALWPPGFQDGAAALARVRQVETSCMAQEGEFDWEKLPPEVQDEYDVLCVLLDRLQDPDGWVTWEDYKAEHSPVFPPSQGGI